MNLIIISVIAFAVSLLVTYYLIPTILKVAYKKNLFDEPNQRKVHHSAIPRLGGSVFVPVTLFSALLAYGLFMITCPNDSIVVTSSAIRQAALCPFAILLIYLVGLEDDLIGVRYRRKFVIQILSALLICLSGLTITHLHGFLYIETIPLWLGVPLTVLLVLFITNAINLIDGLDGLASGITVIALIIYAYVFYYLGIYAYAVLMVAMIGTLVPFMIHNILGKPEKQCKIFMGDTGSLTIGVMLSIMFLKIASIPVDMIPGYSNIAWAIAPLMIPCMDVVRVFFLRIISHGNPFLPDRRHIHHLFLDCGMSKIGAMASVIFLSVIFSTVVMILSTRCLVTWVILGGFALYLLLTYFLDRCARKRREGPLAETPDQMA